MIGLNKIGLNQVQLNLVQLNQLYLNTLCAGQKRSGGDGFPRLPGDVTRWSFKGLTNEQMSKNPRLEDADHKGRFLTFKNFLWDRMSGCNGYSESFSYAFKGSSNSYNTFKSDSEVLIAGAVTGIMSLNYQKCFFDGYIRVSGLDKIANETTGLTIYLKSQDISDAKYNIKKDGIYKIQIGDINNSSEWVYFWIRPKKSGLFSSPVTIEILPNYPGFIIGDGVDDFAVTEKELNFEDTYTVYTAFIPFQNNPTINMILCGADSKKTFSMQYSSLVYVSFIAGNNYYINANFVNGLNLFACKRNGNNICIKNLLTNKVVTGTCGDWVENAGLYYLWKNATYASFAKAAIAGQTICNGYFSTDEDDEKVLDWYKKQYPWLFPDQAWTVTGKTNEDTNRATIANITDNGNNLVLSNFGFAGNSGYGEYAQNFNIDKWTIATPSRVEATKTNSSFNITEVKGTAIQLYYLSTQKEVAFTILSTKVRVTGLTDGQTINYRYFVDDVANDFLIPSDGIYNLPEFEFPAKGDYYGFNLTKVQSSCNITIEQIPNHEGYLVTDGVDDKIESPNFKLDKDFTIVGEWEFLNASAISAGIAKENSLRVFDFGNRLVLYLNSTSERTAYYVRSLNAICSDGRIYDNNWTEYQHEGDQSVESSNSALKIGYLDTYFDKLAFKNFAIYPKVLSKDDCIKAYNYLQTLKAK
nr:MAG TPA: hypothetical protein [Bacteriophage sp.]